MRYFLFRCVRKLRSILGSLEDYLGEASKREYASRVENELKIFEGNANVHNLPLIFHYWSEKYLRPMFNRFGITDPEQFFFLYMQKYAEQNPGKKIRAVSIGCGNCDMEGRLAKRLVENGITAFTIECLDINETMLQRGRDFARELGVEQHIIPLKADFNDWKPEGLYDIVMANQCLHHVVELEKLYAAIKRALSKDGLFLVSDVVGRNGHQRWPEALKLVNQFWRELPDKYKYNRLQLDRHEIEYINHDCSFESFEGIRAQDVLPLLVKNFNFELFIPFGNITFIFIDRPFGHNFDADAQWDRDFIDRVHARDVEAILGGEIKPTQILAVLKNEPVAETVLVHPKLTPEFCVRPV